MKITDANIKVDRELCIACGQCVDRCIMDNLRLSVAPCRQACPLQTNCQGYLRLTAAGKPFEAAQELRKQTLFGAILGRVCTHPCETACTRATEVKDGAVHIRAVKRFLAEQHPEVVFAPPAPATLSGKKVAVVGSGPAGLEAASRLAEAGHTVTVFEEAAKPGGTLRYGVPSYRLPAAELDRSIAALAAAGVTFACNSRMDSLDDLAGRFDAVIVASGASMSVSLTMPGADLPGVVRGLDFLRQNREGANTVAGKRVLVIGGGATALDAALSAKKSGAASVGVVCLEAFQDMPAYAEEIMEAAEEGVVFHTRLAVSALAAGTSGLKLSLRRCLAVFDAQGRFAPELDPMSCIPDMEADCVISAIGLKPDTTAFPGFVRTGNGGLAAEKTTCRAQGKDRVFAAGDCVSGPSTVVQAMAAGKEAAASVCRLLAGEPLESARDPFAVNGWTKEYLTRPETAKNGERGVEPRLPVPQRTAQTETVSVFSPEQALHEAGRCLGCGRSFEDKRTCWFCLPCEIECPQKALYVRIPYLAR